MLPCINMHIHMHAYIQPTLLSLFSTSIQWQHEWVVQTISQYSLSLTNNNIAPILRTLVFRVWQAFCSQGDKFSPVIKEPLCYISIFAHSHAYIHIRKHARTYMFAYIYILTYTYIPLPVNRSQAWGITVSTEGITVTDGDMVIVKSIYKGWRSQHQHLPLLHPH